MVFATLGSQKSRTRLSNVLASLVLAGAVGTAYLNSDPSLAGGESPQKVASIDTASSFVVPQVPPSVPVKIPAGEEGHSDNVAQANPQTPQVLTDKWALQFSIALLEKGIASFKNVDAYSCVFQRHERVDGDLLDPQTISMKLRHAPLSAYMRWTEGDRGRQAIYVDGQHENKLLVQLGGIKGRLLGTLALEPTDSMVMAECRHPVTEIGLLKLAEKVLSNQRADLARGNGVNCQVHDNQSFADRPCFMLVIEYESEAIHSEYRKSIVLIDKALSIPVGIRNYTWTKDTNPETIDESSLVESYAYSEIDIETKLLAADFEKATYRIR